MCVHAYMYRRITNACIYIYIHILMCVYVCTYMDRWMDRQTNVHVGVYICSFFFLFLSRSVCVGICAVCTNTWVLEPRAGDSGTQLPWNRGQTYPKRNSWYAGGGI